MSVWVPSTCLVLGLMYFLHLGSIQSLLCFWLMKLRVDGFARGCTWNAFSTSEICSKVTTSQESPLISQDRITFFLSVADCKTTTNAHSFSDPCSLQSKVLVPSIKTRYLLHQPSNLNWPCDLLWAWNAAQVSGWQFWEEAWGTLYTSIHSLGNPKSVSPTSLG